MTARSRHARPWLRTVLPAGLAPVVGLAYAAQPADRAVGFVVAVATLCVIALLVAEVRGRGRARSCWWLGAVAVALWAAALVGSMLDWSPGLVWGVLRGGGYLAVAVGLVLSPGVRRTAREWGVLLLDGWMIGASSFAVAWVGLGLSGSVLRLSGTELKYPLMALPLDLAVASVCAGLALRTSASARPQSVLLLLATCVAAGGDATWALTGDVRLAGAQFLAVWVLLAAAAFGPGLDLFGSAAPRGGRPRLGRAAQVAAVPGLLAAVVAPVTDVVLATVTVTLVAAVTVELVLLHRSQELLLAEVTGQSRRLDQLVRDSRDAIVQVGPDGVVEFVNDASADVFGQPPQDLTGRPVLELLHPQDRLELAAAALRMARDDATSVRVCARVRHADGSWRHLEATVSRREGDPGTPAGWTASTRDVTDRVGLERELRHRAHTDALTGLTNRHAFLSLLAERLSRGAVAVLFLDLDGFKVVNDSDGHAAGDHVLRRTGECIAGELEPHDVAARLGGDEFAVLLADPGGERGPEATGALLARAVNLADRLVDRLADVLPAGPARARPVLPDQPVDHPPPHHPPTARARGAVSVGVVAADGGPGERTAQSLLRDADLAMYEAKGRGGGCTVVFEDAMRRRVLERSRRRAALEEAIAGEGLVVHLQPLVALHDGSWVGFEALVRWQDGERLRGPGDFVPLAEETGLIVPLGAWVLGAALDWLATWPDTCAGVAVNVAGGQVADPGFVDMVQAALVRSGVDPARLTLEITEATAVADLTRAGAVLQPLRALGVHVALDDFGTGFSSLGYLARLPVDELKIDRRFVAGLGVRPEDEALVRAVIGLAGDLGLRVVAEGVETPDQARRLAELGCAWVQGYLYARPTPVSELAALRAAHAVTAPVHRLIG